MKARRVFSFHFLLKTNQLFCLCFPFSHLCAWALSEAQLKAQQPFQVWGSARSDYNFGTRICINCIQLQHLRVKHINTSQQLSLIDQSVARIKFDQNSLRPWLTNVRACFCYALGIFPRTWKNRWFILKILEVFFAFAWNETCRFIPWQAGGNWAILALVAGGRITPKIDIAERFGFFPSWNMQVRCTWGFPTWF